MKLLIVSDTHGSLNEFDEVIKKEEPNVVIHGGDFAIPLDQANDKFHHFVYGNHDVVNETAKKFPHLDSNSKEGMSKFVEVFIESIPKTFKTMEIGGKKFLLTHFLDGFANNVKPFLGDKIDKNIIDVIDKYEPDYVIYGHTHIAHFDDKSRKYTIINPGTLSKPKSANDPRTYAIAKQNTSGDFVFEIKKYTL
ncbi:putative metallophosphoesterase MG207 homolog [Bacilli bacterium]|nr:putative metallophosphoesterase MG207 homolog [Bacilli bacterium]